MSGAHRFSRHDLRAIANRLGASEHDPSDALAGPAHRRRALKWTIVSVGGAAIAAGLATGAFSPTARQILGELFHPAVREVGASGFLESGFGSSAEPNASQSLGRFSMRPNLLANIVATGMTLASASARDEHCPIAWDVAAGSVEVPPLIILYGPGAQFLDANGDGIKDVVFSSAPVKCRLGLGAGSFGPLVTSDPNGWREGYCVGDLNRDGRDDFVSIDYFAGRARVMRSLGDGGFTQSQALITGNYCTTTRVGDMDGDGDLDIVAGTELEGYLRIFRNDGSGNFDAGTTLNGAGQYHREMNLVDLDADGDLDIVVQNSWNYTTIRVFRNNGGLAFTQMPTLSYPSGGWLSIVPVDFDHDGDVDLVASTTQGELRAYVAGSAPFQFTLQSLGQISAGQVVLTLDDLNNDGVDDLFLSDTGRYGYKLGIASGGFTSAVWTTVTGKDRFTLVDLDNDGTADMAAGKQTTESAGTLDFLLRNCEHPCPGDIVQNNTVDGVDLAVILSVWGTSGSEYPRADTNHDGIVSGPDLAVVLGGWGSCP